jgi:hypothetical protein
VRERAFSSDNNLDDRGENKSAERLSFLALQRWRSPSPADQVLRHQRYPDRDLLSATQEWLKLLARARIGAFLRRPDH